MRLSFVLPRNNFSGGIRVTAILAEELRRRGHQIHLVAAPAAAPSVGHRVRALVLERRVLRRRKPGPYLDDLRDVLTVLDRPRPVTDADLPDADAVVATWWQTAAPVAALSPSKGVKAYFMQDYGAPNQELARLIPTWKLPFTFITLTETLRRQIREHNPEAPIFVVNNAVDTALFAAAPRAKPPRPTFGFVWRAHPSKGIDVALAALARSRHADRLAILAFGPPAGAGSLPAGIEYIARPADAALAGIYGRCTAWLFPSRLEGFGLPITEAMACRTPVIGTRTGAAPDLITSGRNGWLVDVDDAEAMARAIDAAVELSGPAWQGMSEAAYATVANYSWSDAAARFEAALLHAVNHRSAA